MKSIKKFTGVSGNSSLVNPKENMKLRPARLADDALHELEQENKIVGDNSRNLIYWGGLLLGTSAQRYHA